SYRMLCTRNSANGIFHTIQRNSYKVEVYFVILFTLRLILLFAASEVTYLTFSAKYVELDIRSETQKNWLDVLEGCDLGTIRFAEPQRDLTFLLIVAFGL